MNLRVRFFRLAIIVFIISAIVTIYLTQVFITTLLLSVFFVYLLDPIYMYLLRITKNKQISSFLTIAAATSVILSLFFFTATSLLAEVSNLVSSSSSTAVLMQSNLSEAITTFMAKFLPATVVSMLDGIPSEVAIALVTLLKGLVSTFVSNLPAYLAQLILLVFFTYYLITDGRRLIIGFAELMPEKTMVNYFLKELNQIYNIFFRVHFLVASISAMLAIAGFFILGIPYPVTWGILIGFFGLIPELGPAALFVPMSIYYLVIHDINKALFIFFFGEVFLTFIPEYVIRPRLVMIGASIHPILTILAFTAPIFVIGPAGVIIGPAIYGVTLAGYRTIVHFRRL